MGLFPWSRPRLSPAQVGCDIHNHLLPQVDDGARSLDGAVAGLRGLIALGYRGAVLTPHIYPEVFENREEDLRAKFADFCRSVQPAIGDFRLELAAEYFLDEKLAQRVRTDWPSLLCLGRAPRLLLVEFAKVEPPRDLERFFRDCQRQEIRPLIAHIERYALAQSPAGLALLRRWREQGVLLQLNLGSLSGQYGSRIKATARQLWKASLIDLLGSDLHGHEPADLLTDAWRWLGRRAGRFNPDFQKSLVESQAP